MESTTSSFKYYVYILESSKDGDYYKGSTSNFEKRLKEHNEGLSKFTKSKMPWKPIYLQEFDEKSEALIRERKLKKCNRNYIRWLIDQPDNILCRK